MKGTKFIRREALNWILILLPFAYLFAVYDRMPRFAPIPLNWQQAVYYQVIFTMGVAVFGYVYLLVKPAVVPKTAFHENLRIYHRIRTLVLCFLSLLSIIWISTAIGIGFNWAKIGFILAMAFIIIFGNIYPTIRFNYMIGIKNVWTLSNEFIWVKTHRFAGRLFFVAGLTGAVLGILFDPYPVPYMPAIHVGGVFSLLGIAHLYSYLIYRKYQISHS
jgi:uncharacterized membrane protein